MTIRSAALILAFLVVAPPLRADVTIQAKVRSNGFRGMGAFAGTESRSVQGLKSRGETNIDYTGRLMRAVTRPKDAVEIVRIDLDKAWTVFPKRKVYSERPITLPPPEESKSKPAAETGAPADQKPTHRIKKSDFTVTKLPGKKTINGFPTEGNLVKLLTEVEHLETKETATFILETEMWNTPLTPALKKALDEEMNFAKAYMAKLGLKMNPAEKQLFDPRMIGMLLGVEPAKAEDTVDQIKKKMAGVTGYPIVTETRWTTKEDPRVVEARKKAEAEQKAAEEAREKEDDKVDLSGGASGLASGLAGKFARKKMKDSQAKKEEARAAKGDEPMFSTYREITSLSTDAVPASAFEIPAGFKLTK